MQRPAPSILKILFIALVLLLAHSEVAHAQWTKASNGTTNVSNCVLLTDGTVVCQEGETTSTLVRLTPDQFGSYANGSWSNTNISPLPTGYAPRFFCSAVLADGRVVFIGGEYNSGSTGETNLAAILDPTADGGKGTWTTLNPPDGGASPWNQIGDAPCVILPNEKLLLGSIFN